MRLAEKVAIITGGASGIGKAQAKLFSAEGARVVIADIDEAAAEQTVAAIRGAGGEAVFCATDVTQSHQVEQLVSCAVDSFGKLDVLVNTAGLSFKGKGDWLVAEVVESVWDTVIDVNLKGTFLCCKYAVPVMVKGGGGSIVNVASIDALRGQEATSYVASKGGVVALTRSIAVCYAEQNVRANAVCPGPVLTPLALKLSTPEFRRQRDSHIPMKRRAEPLEIAYATLFLASDEASFITGVLLPVDGGETAGRPIH